MPDYMFFMHDDASDPVDDGAWGGYLSGLAAKGCFQGGSAIGPGVSVRRVGEAAPVSGHLTGYLRVSAADLAEARGLLRGNPAFEAGGTIEIRALPRDDETS